MHTTALFFCQAHVVHNYTTIWPKCLFAAVTFPKALSFREGYLYGILPVVGLAPHHYIHALRFVFSQSGEE